MAVNEVQILRDYTSGLEIETTVITAKMKQGQSKSGIMDKNKAILAIPIKDIKYWKYHKKGYFQSHCSRKKQKKPNIQASTVKANRATEFDNNDTPLQANIATKLLDNAAVVIENSQILKDK